MTSRRLASVLAAALLSAGAGTVAVPSAQAASGYCPRGSGVTVVVDRGSLGGGTSIGCDPAGAGAPGSSVVPRAGFSLTYVTRQPGFVCRVAGLPDASSETCAVVPPADAYWGLFWSDGRSGTWSYASVGIGSLTVPAGGFIGWRWQDSLTRRAPGTAPVSPVPAPSPTPQPTTSSPRATSTAQASTSPTRSRTTTGTTARTTAGATGSSPASRSPLRVGTTSKPARSANKAPHRSVRPSPSRATSAAPARVSATGATTASTAEVTSTSADTRTSSGPGLPLLAGGLLVSLLAAAGVLAWRRRGA